MTIHDARTITEPLPPIGSVHTYAGQPVIVTAHLGLYPSLVVFTDERGLRTGFRDLIGPHRLRPAADPWDAHVLQAFAVVAPTPRPIH